jgi:hypothetical protein
MSANLRQQTPADTLEHSQRRDRHGRRGFLRLGAAIAGLSLLGGTLSACGDGDKELETFPISDMSINYHATPEIADTNALVFAIQLGDIAAEFAVNNGPFTIGLNGTDYSVSFMVPQTEDSREQNMYITSTRSEAVQVMRQYLKGCVGSTEGLGDIEGYFTDAGAVSFMKFGNNMMITEGPSCSFVSLDLDKDNSLNLTGGVSTERLQCLDVIDEPAIKKRGEFNALKESAANSISSALIYALSGANYDEYVQRLDADTLKHNNDGKVLPGHFKDNDIKWSRLTQEQYEDLQKSTVETAVSIFGTNIFIE